MPRNCPFCDLNGILLENGLAAAIFDRYPVSTGHTLIIPKRHFESFFEITHEELAACYDLMSLVKDHLDREYRPDAYNVGINIGRAAGQSIMHVHMHLIPRYSGDVKRAKGGVRGVVPDKQDY